MPQGFPDPYSSFSSSFLSAYKVGQETERQKRLEDLQQLDLGIRALTLKNPRARKMALEFMATSNFGGDKARGAELVKTIETFGDEERAAMAADMDAFRKSITGGGKVSPELQSRIDLYESLYKRGELTPENLVKISETLAERAEEMKASGRIGEIIKRGFGAETGTATAAQIPSIPTAIPSVPISPSPEPGGQGSTALAQKLLEESPLAAQVPAAPSLTSPVISTALPAADPRLGKINRLSKIIEGLRLGASVAPTKKGRERFIKEAESYEKLREAEIKQYEQTDAEIARKAKAARESFGDAAKRAAAVRPPLSRIQAEAEVKREPVEQASVRAAEIAAASEEGRRTVTPSAPITREVKRGDKVFTQELDRASNKWKDIASSPRFQEPKKPQSVIATLFANRRDAIARGDKEEALALTKEITAKGKNVQKDILSAITAYRSDRPQDVPEYVSQMKPSEAMAFLIGPDRLLLSGLVQRVSVSPAGKEEKTFAEMAKDIKDKAPLPSAGGAPGTKPTAPPASAPKPTAAKGADSAIVQGNEKHIAYVLKLLPNATDEQLLDTLKDTSGWMKKFTKEQRERSIREVQREMARRKKSKPKISGPQSQLTPEERARREAFAGAGVR